MCCGLPSLKSRRTLQDVILDYKALIAKIDVDISNVGLTLPRLSARNHLILCFSPLGEGIDIINGLSRDTDMFYANLVKKVKGQQLCNAICLVTINITMKSILN